MSFNCNLPHSPAQNCTGLAFHLSVARFLYGGCESYIKNISWLLAVWQLEIILNPGTPICMINVTPNDTHL